MQSRNKIVKQTRNPEKTRSKLLHAARDLFAARGYDGVAVDEIVAKADCNKRMLYHYFGNKDGIYLAVLKDVFSKIETFAEALPDPNHNPRQALRDLIENYFHFLRDNRDFTRLHLWENLNEGKYLAQDPQLLAKSSFLAYLKSIIEQVAAQSDKAPAINAKELVLAITALCHAPFSIGHMLRHSTGLDLSKPDAIKRHLDFTRNALEQLLFADKSLAVVVKAKAPPTVDNQTDIFDEPENFWELG